MKKGVGKVEEKKAIAMEEGHTDDAFTFVKALEEESTAARVIRKCSALLNKFLKCVTQTLHFHTLLTFC